MKVNLGRRALVVWAVAWATLGGWAQSSAGGGSGVLVDGDPVVTTWVVPEYPPEMKAEKVQGRVTVQMIIDQTGKMSGLKVTKSSDPRFNDAVLKALSASVFAPAVEDGKAVEAAVALDWSFNLPYHPPKDQPQTPFRSLPKKPATPESTPNPEYPVTLIERHLDGLVVIDLEIGKGGEVSNFKILNASHPAFVRPAVDAIKSWKFHPATKGDLPVKDAKRAPLTFSYEGRGATDQRSPLEANEFILQVPEGMTAKTVCDKEPEIVSVVDPVLPLELLESGKPGEAEVSFTVSAQGTPEEVSVGNANPSACGLSLAAAVEASVFNPAVLGGRTVAVKLVKKHQFTIPADTPENDESPDARLLRIIRSGEKIPGPRGLDEKLTPLWRAVPRYPSALRTERPKASAIIEFVIDKDGRARVPKIVSTTRDEFGWAAATALQQWSFVPPTRGGLPVDVRVQVPVEFSPP
jgi:TonB family protein